MVKYNVSAPNITSPKEDSVMSIAQKAATFTNNIK